MSDDKTRIDQRFAGVGVGTQLSGIYELDERIASGGMGEVYRGHNIQTGDSVAIKIVLPEFAHDKTILALFRKEASILNHLSHDAVVRYHVFTIDPGIGRPYLSMEFVNGESLFEVLRRGPMPTDEVCKLCHRLTSGLSAVHEAGAIHRDLSPDNIILPGGRVDRAKIIDFGIARSETVGGGTLIDGRFAGKYNYVSPEQLGLFGGQVSAQSDIYSLGLVLAAALRGKPIDMSGSQLDVVEKRRRVPDLSDIDISFRPLLEAMLQPLPSNRPESMAEIARMTRDGVVDVKGTRPPVRPGEWRPAGENWQDAEPSAPPVSNHPGFGGEAAASYAPASTSGPRFVEHVRPSYLSNARPQASAPPAAKSAPVPARTRRPIGAILAGVASLAVVAPLAGAYFSGFIGLAERPAPATGGTSAALTPALEAPAGSPPQDAAATPQASEAASAPAAPAASEGAATPPPETSVTAAEPETVKPAEGEAQGIPAAAEQKMVEAQPAATEQAQPEAAATAEAVEPQPSASHDASAVASAAEQTAAAEPATDEVRVKPEPEEAQTTQREAPLQSTATESRQPQGQSDTASGGTDSASVVEPQKGEPAGLDGGHDEASAAASAVQQTEPQPSTAEAEPLPDTGASGGQQVQPETSSEQVVALNIPKPDVPAGDAMNMVAQRISWLQTYSGGDCFFASAISATDKSIEIEGFGTEVDPFARMESAFQAKFNLEPDIDVRLIDHSQCGVANFLGSLAANGVEKPTLALDRTSIPDGSALSGVLRTEPGLKSSLLLIDHKGMMFNLDDRVVVAANQASFNIPIGLGTSDKSLGKAVPQIVLAVTGPEALRSAELSVPTRADEALPKILSEIREKGGDFSATAKYFRLGG